MAATTGLLWLLVPLAIFSAWRRRALAVERQQIAA
jgi:hypothetical protein